MLRVIEVKKGGRPTKKPNVQEFIMLRSGMTNQEMAERYGVSISTISRWIREYNKEGVENGET